MCETRGPEHLEELRIMIANQYREWCFDRQDDATSSLRASPDQDLDEENSAENGHGTSSEDISH